MQVDQINLSGIVERYIVFKTSGSIKERTQTSSEMDTGCQRNRLVMGVGRGEEVCRKSCPYIRQLAVYVSIVFVISCLNCQCYAVYAYCENVYKTNGTYLLIFFQ